MKGFLLLTLSLVISCSGKTEIITHYPDGMIKSKGYLDTNGLRTGTHQLWNINGVRTFTGEFKDGKMIPGSANGEYVEYYEDGQKKMVINYRNGVKNGDYMFRYKDGTRSVEKYELGLRTYYESYNRDGIIRKREWFNIDGAYREVNFGYHKKRAADGQFILDVDENGTPRLSSRSEYGYQKTDYGNTKVNKLLELWWENGVKKEEKLFNSQGRLDGVSRYWRKDGILWMEETYKDSKLMDRRYPASSTEN